jgi:cysteinyl-tRNA synthetase
MASTFFGSTLDLHTGGQDLAFPHHENEMAQSESHHCVKQWCNVFLHSGHVMLKDTKISKSLGNTIGIDQILSECTPNQFRIMCLATKYHQSFNFSDELLDRAVNTERRLADFMRACSKRTSSADNAAAAGAADGEAAGEATANSGLHRSQQWTVHEAQLLKEVGVAKHKVAAALRKDFDTPAILQTLMSLVSAGHRYLEATKEVNAGVGVNAAVVLIGQTFELLGVELPKWRQVQRMGWGSHIGVPPQLLDRHAARDGTVQQGVPDAAADAFVSFRSQIRQLAVANVKQPQTQAVATEMLHACDALRDTLAAPPIGIVIRDVKEGGAVWHQEDSKSL